MIALAIVFLTSVLVFTRGFGIADKLEEIADELRDLKDKFDSQ